MKDLINYLNHQYCPPARRGLRAVSSERFYERTEKRRKKREEEEEKEWVQKKEEKDKLPHDLPPANEI